MKCERATGNLVTLKSAILALLVVAGVCAAFVRYRWGLGASTNLNDDYPWGLWIGVDVMSGVALAAGGFITAATVYLFGGDKYYPLVRPAVLTGLLGYAFVGVGLLVDLALPWHIWHAIIYWPEHSVMFEVAWCVMLYLIVLALEFAPSVLDRYGWTGKMLSWWRSLSSVFAVIAMAFFVGAMTLSWNWAIVTLLFFGALGLVFQRFTPGRPGVPVMLIIAGVVFSTMHQSSLGSLFLLMKHRLDALWWSPSLPINFFLSAVAVGFAMVIVEATLSSWAFKRPLEQEPLAGMGKFLACALWIYVGFRTLDLVARGSLATVVESDKSNLFLLEMILGFVLPAVVLSTPVLRRNTISLFLAAALVVFGVVLNRCNVAWLGMVMPVETTYVPGIYEFMITIGIVCALILLFGVGVKLLPVFSHHERPAA